MPIRAGHGLVPQSLPTRLSGSWQRCYQSGLRRENRASMEPLGGCEVRQLLQRDVQLLGAAGSELQALTLALAGIGHVAIMVDDRGFVVAVAGDLENGGCVLRRVRCGVELSETALGTNAAGTVLVERQPTLVCGEQHFLSELAQLDCLAVPIMGPGGQLMGALNISSDRRPLAPGVADLAQATVVRMERQLVSDLKSPLLMRLHPHADGVGSATEGLVAVGSDGQVLGLNSAAARMLGVSAEQFCGQALESVFESDPLRASLSNTLPSLRVRNGLALCAQLQRRATLTPGHPAYPRDAVGFRRTAPTDLRMVEELSERELQVLQLLEQGMSNKEMGRRLHIAPDTVKYHLKNIFSKLCVGSRLEANTVARRMGLIQ